MLCCKKVLGVLCLLFHTAALVTACVSMQWMQECSRFAGGAQHACRASRDRAAHHDNAESQAHKQAVTGYDI